MMDMEIAYPAYETLISRTGDTITVYQDAILGHPYNFKVDSRYSREFVNYGWNSCKLDGIKFKQVSTVKSKAELTYTSCVVFKGIPKAFKTNAVVPFSKEDYEEDIRNLNELRDQSDWTQFKIQLLGKWASKPEYNQINALTFEDVIG